jgi:DNA polymerase III subunit epsilon
VRDYFLFIDTEASALPKKWDEPYSKKGNWPHSVQLSWIIYTKDGKEIKQENHYISDNDFEISNSAKTVHGITREFINGNGISRKEVLALLTTDINKYDPLIIGHFIELDFHLIGADCYRAGIRNPLLDYPTFCTMLATTHLVQNPSKKFLKLCDLYSLLFNASMANHHNALEDARATAKCFFELLKRGEIDNAKIAKQEKFLTEPKLKKDNNGCAFIFLIALLLIALTIVFL